MNNLNEYIEWAKVPLRRWKDFAGRSRRKEYWSYSIACLIASMILGAIDGAIFGREVLSAILGLILLVPSFAAMFRRMHDIGKSAWWLLLLIVPLVGWLVIFVFSLMDSQPGTNRYGPNPKGNMNTNTNANTNANV